MIITPSRIPEGNDWVYFGISPNDFENLALTEADILRWIKEASWRLNYYEQELSGDDDE